MLFTTPHSEVRTRLQSAAHSPGPAGLEGGGAQQQLQAQGSTHGLSPRGVPARLVSMRQQPSMKHRRQPTLEEEDAALGPSNGATAFSAFSRLF